MRIMDIMDQSKRKARMERVDALPPELRLLVHEYGWRRIKACLDHGVSNPKTMRSLIRQLRCEKCLDYFPDETN